MTNAFSCCTRLRKWMLGVVAIAWIPLANSTSGAQSLPTPAMTGPLQTSSPHTFDAGPLGTLNVTGIVSGIGMVQGDHVPGDDTAQDDLSNGQVFIQKVLWKMFRQAGSKNIL